MSAFLSEYNVTPTVSGQSIGIIDVINVSGGTGPYTVSWSGATVNGYTTSTQWDQHNLAEGVYKATITDTNSNKGTTLVNVSAYTNPTFSALVTSYSCVTNPNLYCELTVYSAGTNVHSEESQYASTFNYSLYRDGTLFESKIIPSGSSSATTVFKNLTNGEYMLNIGREQSLTRNFKVTDAQCTASSINVSATSKSNFGVGSTQIMPLSSITSAYTINSHFAAGEMYIGNTPGFYTTGLHNWGRVLNTPGHWFFTGNSDSGGVMDYPNVNPNTARTTDTDRYWYLGMSGSSDCQEGWNCGPTGPNTDPVVALTQKDLTGATIEAGDSHAAVFRGTYYYHRYLNKFFMWDSTTGTTTDDYAWVTFNPTADRDSKGDPVSSEIITQNQYTFENKMLAHVGADNIFPKITNSDVVADYSTLSGGNENNYVQTEIKHSFISGDTSRASLISPCSYLDYTHDVYLFQSGGSDSSASVVLAYFRDSNATYGESGATHYITLDFQQSSGVTVSFNKGQSARAFQRDVYGEQIIQGNPEDSDEVHVQELVLQAMQQAIYQFVEEYPDLAGVTPDEIVDIGIDELFEMFSEQDVFVGIYETILLQLLTEYEATLEESARQYVTTQYKEFSTIVLRNQPNDVEEPAGGHRSPYDLGSALTTQGAIKVRVIRSGSQGERFRIQMTPSMGKTSNTYATNATVNIGTDTAYLTYHEINFDLTDSNTWSGTSQSAPTWVTGTELQRFLGGTRVGYMVNDLYGIFYGVGLTGTAANYTVTPTSPTFISSNSAITLTETTTYNPNLSISSQNLGEVVGNNNVQFSKNCDFYPRCGSKLTVPLIRPKASATLQTFKEPIVILEGLSKSNSLFEDLKIINLSGYTGNTPVVTANTSGNTSDLLLGKSYLKLNVYGFNYLQNKVNLKPDYSYIFNTLSEISNPPNRKQGIALSSTTIPPLSGLPTASTWEYIFKPSFIIKDKSTKDPVWVDTYNPVGGVTIDSNKDYYMCLVSPPDKPAIRNREIGFDSDSEVGNLRIVTKQTTVSGVPDFGSAKSAFTWSALTLPYPPLTNVQVVVNGLTMKPSSSLVTASWKNNSSAFLTGDYFWDGIRLQMAPRSVKNGDIVQVLYPATSHKSYYYQTLTVGTVSTTNTAVIYKDDANYYINLDYEAFGGIQLILNGQTLTEGVDFERVTPQRIQILTYVVGGAIDFEAADVISMYYLTQYDVVGLASTKEPLVDVTINKQLYLIEEVKLIVFDTNGNIVQEELKKYPSTEGGSVSTNFTISVPAPGTYSYNLQTKRYYPLLSGKDITTSNNTKNITFIIDKTTFYSPYIKRNRIPGRGGGGY